MNDRSSPLLWKTLFNIHISKAILHNAPVSPRLLPNDERRRTGTAWPSPVFPYLGAAGLLLQPGGALCLTIQQAKGGTEVPPSFRYYLHSAFL